jgi:hypothetical protein
VPRGKQFDFFVFDEYSRISAKALEMAYISDYMRGSNSNRCEKAYTYEELINLEQLYQGTEGDSKHWRTKTVADPRSYKRLYYVFLDNLQIPLEVWERERFKNRQYTQTRNRFSETYEPYEHPSDPPTITIHHKKTERIEIREIRPGELKCLKKIGRFYCPALPLVSTYSTISSETSITHFEVTEQDILNQTIFESERT